MPAIRLTNDAIEAAAIRRLNCHAALVFAWQQRGCGLHQDQPPVDWHGLSIRRAPADDLEVVGMRRSRTELLAMVELIARRSQQTNQRGTRCQAAC
jgi:hypothetical protein